MSKPWGDQEEEMALLITFLVCLCWIGFHVYQVLWLRPKKIRQQLNRQGIAGPKPSFFFGNVLDMKRINASKRVDYFKGEPISHEFKLYPCFDVWRKEYGSILMYSTGNSITVYVTDPNLVKEVMLCTSLDIGKPSSMRKGRSALLGDSVITANGHKWVHDRKIIAPEFCIDKVKGMVNLMVEATLLVVQSWESRVELEGGIADIMVDEDMKNLSADVISRACFGSNYLKGRDIFTKLRALQAALSDQFSSSSIPGFRYIPNKSNRAIWKLEKEIHTLILKVVNDRKNEERTKCDLLQIILERGDRAGSSSSNRFIVDNCKAVYFAGHETTSTTAKWALVLLALHPEWQAHARAEVTEICAGEIPNFEKLHQMRTLTKVIQETMRLYAVTPFNVREALQNVKLGGFFFTKGTNISIPMAALQQDTAIWGQDAKIFNPDRFANGPSRACKFPHMYMPFGFGPRVCLGQNFAMVELKIILSLILTKFSFTISPNYRHSVTHRLVLDAEYGVNLLVQKV